MAILEDNRRDREQKQADVVAEEIRQCGLRSKACTKEIRSDNLEADMAFYESDCKRKFEKKLFD